MDLAFTDSLCNGEKTPAQTHEPQQISDYCLAAMPVERDIRFLDSVKHLLRSGPPSYTVISESGQAASLKWGGGNGRAIPGRHS